MKPFGPAVYVPPVATPVNCARIYRLVLELAVPGSNLILQEVAAIDPFEAAIESNGVAKILLFAQVLLSAETWSTALMVPEFAGPFPLPTAVTPICTVTISVTG